MTAAPVLHRQPPPLDARLAAALLLAAEGSLGLPSLVASLAHAMRAEGLPLARVGLQLMTQHPTVRALTLLWHAGPPEHLEQHARPYGTELLPQYLASPIAAILERGGDEIHLPMARLAPPWTYPVQADFAEQGVTDYLALPLAFTTGRQGVLTVLTHAPGGLAPDRLDMIRGVLPLVTTLIEREAHKQRVESLLNTYVGRRTGARILAGEVRRGTGATLNAVLWFSDLRGFTALSDRLPREDLIALLNNYFEIQGNAVEEAGGEILKFMGDGMLALWALDGEEPAATARAALQAAETAIAGMQALNAERADWGQPYLGCGIALHAGDVMYGNIGAPDRLDFTVIGPAVNLASRIEGLCQSLDRQLLTSRAFADLAGGCGLVPLGAHRVRGLDTPVEVLGHPSGL
jgi:adenylate cyclase